MRKYSDTLSQRTRRDVVTAFLSRLENVGTENLSLIPALERYIETGDIDFFDAFNEFLFIWDTSEKTAQAEARKERYELAMSELDEAVREYSRYLDKIKKQFKVITKGVEKEVKESAEQRKALYDSLEKLVEEFMNQRGFDVV